MDAGEAADERHTVFCTAALFKPFARFAVVGSYAPVRNSTYRPEISLGFTNSGVLQLLCRVGTRLSRIQAHIEIRNAGLGPFDKAVLPFAA